MRRILRQRPKIGLAETAAALQLGRVAFPWRRAEVARSREQAIAQLEAVRQPDKGAPGGGLVLVFPGQGAQFSGLDRDSMTRCPAFARHFSKCAELFRTHAGVNLDDIFAPQTAAQLMASAPGYQAALFAVEYALGETLIEFGLRPSALAGHSLGQIVAATVGGMLRLDDAVRLVAVRAAAMQDAAPGAMLSLAVGAQVAGELLADWPGAVIAAINSPRDVTVSGTIADIAGVERAAARSGIVCQRLAVSRAFHSPMMKAAADRVAEVAATMSCESPRIPVACNVTGGWLGREAADDPGTYWSRHILAPVDFAGNAAALAALRPAAVVEAGPGRSLTRLVREAAVTAQLPSLAIVPAMRHAAETGASDWEALCRCLARVWELGFDIGWGAFREGRTTHRAVLPTYPFQRRRCWPTDDAALQGSPASVRAREAKLPPEQRFYVPSFRQVIAPPASASPAGMRWLLLRDFGGVRGALSGRARSLVEGPRERG